MKILVASDIHLGSFFSKESKFIEFLKQAEADLLILNGDIYDTILGNPVIDIFSLIDSNKKIKDYFYILGNHDTNIKEFFKDLEVHNKFEIADIVIFHGHTQNITGVYQESITNNSITSFRYLFEMIFKINIRLFVINLFKSIFNSYNLSCHNKAIALFPDKKVIIGHTHVPNDQHPYYNSGGFVDNINHYLEINIDDNNISNIKSISY